MRVSTRFSMRLAVISLSLGIVAALSGCRDLSNPALPDGLESPDTYLSKQGGLMLAETALREFRDDWRFMAIVSGQLTDELSSYDFTAVDQRLLPDGVDAQDYGLYSELHQLRGQARIARAVLAEYAPDLSPALRARLYAYEGYADIWLADLYCSGVPLSTIDFKGDYTNEPPSTTQEIYSTAATLFDSALALAADSAAVQTLARVGKGRALLAIGRYADAEAAVAGVQVSDAYLLRISFNATPGVNQAANYFAAYASVADQEGTNGLPFRSDGDPRTASPLITLPVFGTTRAVYFPSKYAIPNDSNWVPVASGIEAQLIKAEAALQRNDATTWLTMLNTLRTTGSYTRIDTIYTDSTHTTIARTDTTWQAGTGGVAGLRPLSDPGAAQARTALMFSERAAWLFVAGQRQGDLRRLIREYGAQPEDVYPTGVYIGATTTSVYGSDINIPIPIEEQRNPLVHGCLNRD